MSVKFEYCTVIITDIIATKQEQTETDLCKTDDLPEGNTVTITLERF